MAKSAFSSFAYSGDLNTIQEAVFKAVERMQLKIHDKRVSSDGFMYLAKEPMRWLTTNWPITLTIEATRSGESWAVTLEASCGMASITQDGHNNQRVNELAELIKTYIP